MAEVKREVKTFIVSYVCDSCGEGEMLPNGIMLTSNPPKYPHVCTKCGKEEIITGFSYPKQVMEYT